MVSLIGLLQHVQLLPFAMPSISVPGSTLGNRNMAGEAVAMAVPFGLAAVALQRAARGRVRLAAAIILLLAELVFLAVTRARGAWIGGALGVVAFFAVRRPALPRRALLLLVPVAAVVLGAALLPGRWHARDANDTKRYEPGARVVLDVLDPASSVVRTRTGLWRRTLAIYGTHPLTGVGPGNFAVLFPLVRRAERVGGRDMSATMVPRRAHNELLERLAETGPLGLAALVALFVTALGAALAVARATRAQSGGESVSDVDAASAAAGSIAACFGCGLTAFPLAMPATALLFGASLGVIDALAAREALAARAAGGAADRRCRPHRRRGTGAPWARRPPSPWWSRRRQLVVVRRARVVVLARPGQGGAAGRHQSRARRGGGAGRSHARGPRAPHRRRALRHRAADGAGGAPPRSRGAGAAGRRPRAGAGAVFAARVGGARRRRARPARRGARAPTTPGARCVCSSISRRRARRWRPSARSRRSAASATPC